VKAGHYYLISVAKSELHSVSRHRQENQPTVLVERARKRRNKAQGTPLSDARQPNALWCADCKGEFKLGNGQYLLCSDTVEKVRRVAIERRIVFVRMEMFELTSMVKNQHLKKLRPMRNLIPDG
jgi:hypothetical protein